MSGEILIYANIHKKEQLQKLCSSCKNVVSQKKEKKERNGENNERTEFITTTNESATQTNVLLILSNSKTLIRVCVSGTFVRAKSFLI